MNTVIDLTQYLPSAEIQQPKRESISSILQTVVLALESIVTAVIGLCMMAGIAAFLLML